MTSRKRSRSHRRVRSRRSRIALIVILGCAALTLVTIFGALLTRRAPEKRDVAAAPAVVSIQFNAPFGGRFAGVIVADSSGLFHQANIQAKLIPGQSDDDVITSVVEGRAVVGVVDPIRFLKARAKGQPIVAFAADYVESATVFYALEKTNVRSPEDFVGKRVGRLSGTREAIFYDALLRMRGISRSDVRETDKNVDVEGLLAGDVDVIPGRVGLEAYMLKSRDVSYTAIRLLDFSIHVPDLVYIVTEKMIRDHPSMLSRLLNSIIAGWNRTYADPRSAARHIADRVQGSVSADQIEFELAAQRDHVVTVGRRRMEFDTQQWKQLLKILVNSQQLDEYFDLAKAVNYSILKDAYRKPISFGNDPTSEPAPILGR